MFQQVVRWTFIITIWKKYKGQLLTTIGYLAGLVLVSFVHQDYLEYLSAAGEGKQNVGLSFALKWLAYIGLTVIFYFVFSQFSSKTQQRSGHKGLGFLAKFKSAGKKRSEQSVQSVFGEADGRSSRPETSRPNVTESGQVNRNDDANVDVVNDPFAKIRAKEKLRSEADAMLDLNKKNEG